MAEYWLLVCALACSSVGAWWATSDPTSRRVRRIEFLAWILGIVGAVTLADQLGGVQAVVHCCTRSRNHGSGPRPPRPRGHSDQESETARNSSAEVAAADLP